MYYIPNLFMLRAYTLIDRVGKNDQEARYSSPQKHVMQILIKSSSLPPHTHR
jgi:hypothetical protein